MKIIIFGAAGGIGKYIVEQACAAGHEVTAFQHKAPVLSDSQQTIRIVQGDLFDLLSVKEAVRGQDIVLTSHGARTLKDRDVYLAGTSNILLAMQEHSIKRLVSLTSAAVDDNADVGFFFGKIIKPLFLKNGYKAMQQAEGVLEQSDLDWTIVRPGALTDGPHTATYRVSDQGMPKGSLRKISRMDVADLMVKEATDARHIHKKLVIVY